MDNLFTCEAFVESCNEKAKFSLPNVVSTLTIIERYLSRPWLIGKTNETNEDF